MGQKYGRKYHITLYVATSALCLLLVPNMEENLVFIGLFGWYPILRPCLQKLPNILRWISKLAIFNAVIILIEWLVMSVLAPEAVGQILLWVLLILGNITFLAYDFMIPKMEILMGRITKFL